MQSPLFHGGCHVVVLVWLRQRQLGMNMTLGPSARLEAMLGFVLAKCKECDKLLKGPRKDAPDQQMGFTSPGWG